MTALNQLMIVKMTKNPTRQSKARKNASSGLESRNALYESVLSESQAIATSTNEHQANSSHTEISVRSKVPATLETD